MKEVWVLNVKTSLPDTCWDRDELKETTKCYETFADAKEGFIETIQNYATNDNAMFDSDGHIKYLDKYIDDIEEDEAFDDDDSMIPRWATRKFYTILQDDLSKLFSGKLEKLSCLEGEYEDCFISAKITSKSIKLVGTGDGPINGIDPVIKTNILDMSREKKYYLHIDDFFGGLIGQEYSAELHMTLEKYIID